MGLDMYLSKKNYVGAMYDFLNVKGTIDITIGDKKLPINFNRVSYIEEEVGYWRKANAIHKWFVDNVQNGEDNCREYYVGIDTLKELLEICKKIDEHPSDAKELLPTQEGFFFGDTAYNEWYFEDIKKTIKMLEGIIKEEKELNETYNLYSEFYYRASW